MRRLTAFAGVFLLAGMAPVAGAQTLYGENPFAGGPIPIPLPGPVNNVCTPGTELFHTIMVPDVGVVGDLNVHLNISHTWYGDLDIMVTSPMGTVAFVKDGIPDDSSDLIGTYVLDDEAPGSWDAAATAAGATIPLGSYFVDVPLSVFDGESITGVWTITICDTFAGDLGTLNGAVLEITLPGLGTIHSENFESGGTGAYIETDLARNPAPTLWHGEDKCGEFDWLLTPSVIPGPSTLYGENPFAAGPIAIPLPGPVNNVCTPGTELFHMITVPDPGVVADLNVHLNITHTWYGDLDIMVTSPMGTVAFVKDGVPDDSSNLGGTYILDDEAGGSWDAAATAAGVLIPPGSYTVDVPLSTFDGEPRMGVWTITICDTFAGDVGTLNGAVLEFGTPGTPTYVASKIPSSFTSILGGPGTVVLWGAANDDTGSAAIALPPGVSFFGAPAAMFRVNNNGFMAIDPAAAIAGFFTNAVIPAAAAPNGILAPWWDDLHTGPLVGGLGSVAYLITPGGSLVVEWNMMEHFAGNLSGENISFQAVIDPAPANTITYHYDHATFLDISPSIWTASVGVENSTGTVGVDATGGGTTNRRLPNPIPSGFGTNAAAYNQGDIGIYTFNTPGLPNEGALESPLISPAATADNLSLTFHQLRETEDAGLVFDQSFVQARATDGCAWKTVLQTTFQGDCKSGADVVTVESVELNCLIPTGGNIRFAFDTIDSVGNNYLGWYVDNISVTASAAAGVDRYGAGCACAGPCTPKIQTLGGTPALGNGAFEVGVCNALGGSFAALFVGFDDPVGTPIKPGCLSYLDLLLPVFHVARFPVLPGTGAGEGCATVPLPVPMDMGLVGGMLAFQWAVLDPAAMFGFCLSDAVKVTVQP